jgi:hypothetical protein
LQALLETGATGLEPATSGVTGRDDGNDERRRETTEDAESLMASGIAATQIA